MVSISLTHSSGKITITPLSNEQDKNHFFVLFMEMIEGRMEKCHLDVSYSRVEWNHRCNNEFKNAVNVFNRLSNQQMDTNIIIGMLCSICYKEGIVQMAERQAFDEMRDSKNE